MAKKQPRKFQEDTPIWFSSLDQLPPYHDLRIPTERVDEVLREIFNTWHHPESSAAIHAQWENLSRFQQRIRRDLAAKNWSAERSHQIVEFVVARSVLDDAVAKCLPDRFKAIFPPSVFQFVFSCLLLAHGHTWVEAYPDDTLTAQYVLDELPADLRHLNPEDRGMLPLKRAIVVWESARYAEDEFARRARQHLGFHAAVLVAVSQSRSEVPSNDLVSWTEESIDALRGATWHEAKRRVTAVLESRMEEHDRKATLDANLSGNVWMSVMDRWGAVEALNAIAHALDGKMNVIHRAIVDDILGNLHRDFPPAAASYMASVSTPSGRKRRRKFVSEGPLDESDGNDKKTTREKADLKITIREVVQKSAEQLEYREREVIMRQLAKHQKPFLAKFPQYADGLEVLLYDGPKTQAALARERGYSVQALHKHKNSAIAAFRKYLKI